MVKIKRLLSISISVGFAGWVVWFIRQRVYYFDQLFQVEWYSLTGLVLLFLCWHVLNGLLLRCLVSAFQITLAIVESTAISLVTSILNFVTPFRGGVGYRAYYLNRRHGMALGHFISVFGSFYLLDFLVKSCVAIIIILYTFLRFEKPYLSLAVVFSILGMVCFYIVFFAPSVPESGGRIWIKIAKTVNSWDYIRRSRSILWHFGAISILQVVLSGLILQLAFSVSKISVGFSECVLLAIMASFGIMLGLTPGSIGIVEGIFLLTSPLVGVVTEEMLVGALIRRGADLLALVVFSPIGWLWLMFNKSDRVDSQPR